MAMPVDATIPDWSRETPKHLWDSGAKLLRAIRGYQNAASKSGFIAKITKFFYILSHRFWTQLSGADIPLNTIIGGGLIMPHPNGIVIHPDAKIGPNCIIFQQVTLGTNQSQPPPQIGGDVALSAGAKLIGPITVGDHVIVGANAVVTKDAPSKVILAGIPAKIIKPHPDHTETSKVTD